MPTNTASATAALRGLTAKFDIAVEQAQPFYPEICTLVRSTGADEKYGFLGAMPGMREWIGDRQFAQLRAGDFKIANRLWEASLRIEREDIEDDRIGLYETPLAALGEEAAYHPDELVFDLLINGETGECFDGQNFFDTDHVWGESGTQSNDLTATAADPNAPTEAEFRAAYHAARAAMLSYRNDQGKLFMRPTIRPLTGLILLVPPAMEETAARAINKLLVNGGETNIVLDQPRIVASGHLTSPSKFYLLNVQSRLRPFIFQARRPLQRQMKGLDDREFKDVKFMADARYNVGYGAWWNAVLTTFTA